MTKRHLRELLLQRINLLDESGSILQRELSLAVAVIKSYFFKDSFFLLELLLETDVNIRYHFSKT